MFSQLLWLVRYLVTAPAAGTVGGTGAAFSDTLKLVYEYVIEKSN